MGTVWLLRVPGMSSVPTCVMAQTAAADSSARQTQKTRCVATASAVKGAPRGTAAGGTDLSGRLGYTGGRMPSQRSALRILMNVALDGALAAVAAVVARWVADPDGGLLHPLWFLAGGAITLLVGGLPFRLSQQYWRFSAMEDLVGVAGGSVISALLFAAIWSITGYPLPTPTFPVVHAMTLVVFLGAPRVVYRLVKARPRARTGQPVQTVLLVGAGEGADSFLRALASERDPALRVAGLLAMGRNQTGRRMQGLPILGGVSDMRRVLDRLAARDSLPDALVVTDPAFTGKRLGYLLEEAQQRGIPRAPGAAREPTCARRAGSS